MSESANETAQAPVKKAAAPRKRAAAKKATPAKTKVAVVMVGNSRGAKNGDRRMVDTATAKRLIAHRQARKPD